MVEGLECVCVWGGGGGLLGEGPLTHLVGGVCVGGGGVLVKDPVTHL